MRRRKFKEIKNGYGFRTIYSALMVGLFAGGIVSFYRLALSKTTHLIYPLYSQAIGNPWLIALIFLALGLCGYIVGWFIKIEPMITGSGIPQVQGILLGKMKFNWVKVVIFKFIGGIISLGSGLSLGREGPSIQLGAATGIGIGRFLRGNRTERKMMMTYGSSAGLAAAFNAPFAGVLFSLEELHKSFSKVVLIGVMTAAITADFVSKIIFGVEPVFSIPINGTIGLEDFWILIFLGLVLGILGVVFNKTILLAVSRYEKVFKLPIEFKPIIPFLCAGVAGLTLPIILGGGHELVEELVKTGFSIKFLLLLLVAKFLFTVISYSSSAPGGIFLPLLSIGAIIGCITAKIFVVYFGFDSAYINIFIVLAMAGYFSSVVKSPITGIILISEMTGGFKNFLSLSIVCIISYVVSDILNGEPVYEMLLHHSLNKNDKPAVDNEPVILNIPIIKGNPAENKSIKEINIPYGSLIISVKRNEKEIIPRDDMVLISGDYVVISTHEKYVNEVKGYFE